MPRVSRDFNNSHLKDVPRQIIDYFQQHRLYLRDSISDEIWRPPSPSWIHPVQLNVQIQIHKARKIGEDPAKVDP